MTYIGDSILEYQKFFNEYLLSLNPNQKLDLWKSPDLIILVFSVYQSNHILYPINFS